MTHDFTGKSIKCETWEQMLHLAKLAEEQGISKPKNDDYWFSKHTFNDKYCYFMVVDSIGYINDIISDTLASKIVTYYDFINTLPTEVVEVTGCGDCPFRVDSDIVDNCSHPNFKRNSKYDPPFTTCPLLIKSITIKLKQND
jgi:hypothetical protein